MWYNDILMKKLYRARTDAMLGGVCGGIASYFNWDSTLIRLASIIILMIGHLFIPIVAYFLAWIIIPVEPDVIVHDIH